MRKNLFVKVSGDLIGSAEFIEYMKKLTRKYFTVICVGGGSQINKELERLGITPGPHGPLGRELPNLRLKQLARDILEQCQGHLQDRLAELGVTAVVTIPVIDIGSVLCHVNGDQMVRTAYIGFDKLIIFTKKKRVEKKAGEFKGLEKVEVIGID